MPTKDMQMDQNRSDTINNRATLRLVSDGNVHCSAQSSEHIPRNAANAKAVSVTLLHGPERDASDKTEDGLEDEILGAICLEDFADGEPDGDYAFLDGLNVEMGTDNDSIEGDWNMSAPTSDQGSFRKEVLLDAASVRWITDEREFAALFAQVGVNVDDLFDADNKSETAEFRVDDQVLNEWRAAGEEHNRRCVQWTGHDILMNDDSETDGAKSPMDIRLLAGDFHPRSSSLRNHNQSH